MSIGSKLVAFLCLSSAFSYPAALANPAEKRVARSSNDLYDWLSSLFDYDDSESEEYLLCRNCTVVVSQGQRNGTDSAAPPNGNEASTVPTPPAPTPAPTAAPTAAPTPAAPPAADGAAVPPVPPAQG